jgi:hypothetical protein
MKTYINGWKGFSVWIAFGSYAGFGVFRDRIVLGWVSIVFWFPYDVEKVLDDLTVDSTKYQDMKAVLLASNGRLDATELTSQLMKIVNRTRYETQNS